MPALLPEHWKQSLERVGDKIGNFLGSLVPHGNHKAGPENMTFDLLPAFMPFGGPLLDMYESGHELVVTIEVPGLKKEDISVELVGKRLTVKGEKQFSRESKAGDRLKFSERKYGSFARSVQLPCYVEDGAINAELKNGVLTIRLPRLESERSGCKKVSVS
jgi:HSP20 family protein